MLRVMLESSEKWLSNSENTWISEKQPLSQRLTVTIYGETPELPELKPINNSSFQFGRTN